MDPDARPRFRILPMAGVLLLLLTCAIPANAQYDHPGAPISGSDEMDARNAPAHRRGNPGGPRRAPDEDHPVAPVPEPGMMALASMGLVALGTAVRKHRPA
ncbi:MAG: PEP-CTERM sorting domain-containing protein [Candidatus Eisenbacteria bacterium]|nr:PEP-CTERM sorting domain-containing protein [Candidatus Eisenbacteria bacterium]